MNRNPRGLSLGIAISLVKLLASGEKAHPPCKPFRYIRRLALRPVTTITESGRGMKLHPTRVNTLFVGGPIYHFDAVEQQHLERLGIDKFPGNARGCKLSSDGMVMRRLASGQLNLQILHNSPILPIVCAPVASLKTMLNRMISEGTALSQIRLLSDCVEPKCPVRDSFMASRQAMTAHRPAAPAA